MKRPYTIYSPTLRRLSKLSGNTPDECIDAFILRIAELQSGKPLSTDWYGYSDSQDDPNKCLVSLYCFWLEKEIMDGKCVHFFLPNRQFCDWIVSCVPHLNAEHAALLQHQIGRKAIVTHFPTDCGVRSAGCLAGTNRTLDVNPDRKIVQLPAGSLIVSMSACGQKESAYCIGLNDPERAENTIRCSPESLFHAKLFVGLGMYLHCFPEMLKEGPPSDIKHPSQHNYATTQTIGVSPRITTSSHDSPAPHFRKGHFRLLSSEKFTHKRFQVVFVHETFVCGTSKTVLPI